MAVGAPTDWLAVPPNVAAPSSPVPHIHMPCSACCPCFACCAVLCCAVVCCSYLDMLETMRQMERQRELQRLRELDLGEAAEGEDTEQQAQQGQRDPPPLLTFTPSVELNELVRPLDRCVCGVDGRRQRAGLLEEHALAQQDFCFPACSHLELYCHPPTITCPAVGWPPRWVMRLQWRWARRWASTT